MNIKSYIVKQTHRNINLRPYKNFWITKNILMIAGDMTDEPETKKVVTKQRSLIRIHFFQRFFIAQLNAKFSSNFIFRSIIKYCVICTS